MVRVTAHQVAEKAGVSRRLHARGDGAFIPEQARSEARRICEGDGRPDALFVANDHMAFPLMDALRHDLGLDVPHDISVIGYDDVPPRV